MLKEGIELLVIYGIYGNLRARFWLFENKILVNVGLVFLVSFLEIEIAKAVLIIKTNPMEDNKTQNVYYNIFINAFKLWILQEGEKWRDGVFATSDGGITLGEILEQMKNGKGWGYSFLLSVMTSCVMNEQFRSMDPESKEKTAYVFFQSRMRKLLFFPNV